MWLALAFISAALLGVYDVSKKAAVRENAVIPVLLLNVLFECLIFLPFTIDSAFGFGWFAGTPFDTVPCPPGAMQIPLFRAHMLLVLKSVIVLSSWILGYFGLKHLPITIVGPINAIRPVLVLLGAIFIFGERLNWIQWTGVAMAFVSLFMLSCSSRKDKIDFFRDKWIWLTLGSVLMATVSALYDRFLMNRLSPLFVQGWYVPYQLLMMSVVLLVVWYPTRKETTPFHWSWAIPLVAVFIASADVAYLMALSTEGSMISVISLIRRGSVIVSFALGALIFKEKNLKAKALDLLFILAGMIVIWLGSR